MGDQSDVAARVEERLGALVPYGSLGLLDADAVVDFERDAPTGVIDPAAVAAARAFARLRDAEPSELDAVAEEVHAAAALVRPIDSSVADGLLDWLDDRRGMPRHVAYPAAPRDRDVALEHYLVPLVPGAAQIEGWLARVRHARSLHAAGKLDQLTLDAFELVLERKVDRESTWGRLAEAGFARAATALVWPNFSYEFVPEAWSDALAYDYFRDTLWKPEFWASEGGRILAAADKHEGALCELLRREPFSVPERARLLPETALLISRAAVAAGRDDVAIAVLDARQAWQREERDSQRDHVSGIEAFDLVIGLVERNPSRTEHWFDRKPFMLEVATIGWRTERRRRFIAATGSFALVRGSCHYTDALALDRAGAHEIAVSLAAEIDLPDVSDLGRLKRRRYLKETRDERAEFLLLKAEAALLKGDVARFRTLLTQIDETGARLDLRSIARRLEMEIVAADSSAERNKLMSRLAEVSGELEADGVEVAWSPEMLRQLRDVASEQPAGRAIALSYAHRLAVHPDLNDDQRVHALLDLAERLEEFHGNDASLTQALSAAAEVATSPEVDPGTLAQLNIALGRNVLRRDGATEEARAFFDQAREQGVRAGSLPQRMAADAYLHQYWRGSGDTVQRSLEH